MRDRKRDEINGAVCRLEGVLSGLRHCSPQEVVSGISALIDAKISTVVVSDETTLPSDFVLVPRDGVYNPGILNAVYANFKEFKDLERAFGAGVEAMLDYHESHPAE